MPHVLARFLDSRSWKFHFFLALALGLLVRVIASRFAYGSQALDDFRHGLWPAYQFYNGEWINLPDYRSYLLVWVLGDWFKMGDALFGISTPAAQAQWCSLGLGVFSLWVFFPLYQWGKDKSFATLSTYLIALHALLPFVTTRAFGEAVATSLVLGGLLACELGREQKKTSWLIFGFLTLGLSALFRFQCGVIYVAYLGFLLFKKETRPLVTGLACGLVIFALQCLVEVLAHRPLLSTLFAYFDANKNVGQDYGESPWHATWATFLAFLFFPVSLSFFRKTSTKLWGFLFPCLIFLFLHCLVPHKEERFLYPVLGLAALFLSALWVQSRPHVWNRFVASPIILILNFTILALSIFSNTQSGEIEPIAQIEKMPGPILVVGKQALLTESFVKDYYVRTPNKLIDVGSQVLNGDSLSHLRTGEKTLCVITSNADLKVELEALEGQTIQDLTCQKVRKAQSLTDQILYQMHPEKNPRRRPTWYLVCSKLD